MLGGSHPSRDLPTVSDLALSVQHTLHRVVQLHRQHDTPLSGVAIPGNTVPWRTLLATPQCARLRHSGRGGRVCFPG